MFQLVNHEALYNHLPIITQDREQVEHNVTYLQLIPYVVLIDKNIQENGDTWVLSYRRKGSEERLYDNYSIGFGGHWATGETLYECIARELKEELNCSYDEGLLEIDNTFFSTFTVPVDLLYVQEDDIDGVSVNNVHLGILFAMFTNTAKLLQKLKGTNNDEVISLERVLLSSVNRNISYEAWSTTAVKKLFARIPDLVPLLRVFNQYSRAN
jgi:predicted NUDIX family phosphoesterase